jgi:hypothetical protein
MTREILTNSEREIIRDEVVAALNSMGIGELKYHREKPGSLPHWQLIVESNWCAAHSPDDTRRAGAQAKTRAGVDGPLSCVVLISPKDH